MATKAKKALVDVDKLTKAQAKVEHMRLSLEIEAHNERYYQKDAPTVSDAAYDALRQRLEADGRAGGSADAARRKPADRGARRTDHRQPAGSLGR